VAALLARIFQPQGFAWRLDEPARIDAKAQRQNVQSNERGDDEQKFHTPSISRAKTFV
jgi:hypothetical protein